MDKLSIGQAAKYLGIRSGSLLAAAQTGRLPFEWGLTTQGQKQRLFEKTDLETYAARQREKLLARLATLDGGKATIPIANRDSNSNRMIGTIA